MRPVEESAPSRRIGSVTAVPSAPLPGGPFRSPPFRTLSAPPPEPTQLSVRPWRPEWAPPAAPSSLGRERSRVWGERAGIWAGRQPLLGAGPPAAARPTDPGGACHQCTRSSALSECARACLNLGGPSSLRARMEGFRNVKWMVK